MSQLVQAEFQTLRPTSKRFLDALPSWQLGTLAALTLWLYGPTLTHLLGQWWHDPNFSHGFFVPAFSAFVVWQGRTRLAQIPLKPSWSGLAILALALAVLVIGQTGAELFLARSSLLLLLSGLIVLFLGWNYLRALLFPMAFLVLMIPIPAIVFNQITFPLQLLASRLSAGVLEWLGVPVLREGNVINLPAMALQVVEACSGIRSLLSLTTLAIIYGYLMDRNIAVRVVLAALSAPIAVVANGSRIVGTGLLVQYWDPDKAVGFFHVFSGWLIFVVSLFMLYSLHRLIRAIWREPKGRNDADDTHVESDLYKRKCGIPARSGIRFLVAAVLTAAVGLLLQVRGRNEVFAPRLPLQSFPMHLGTWTATDIPLDKEVLDVLGPGDFLLRDYHPEDSVQPPVDLFIAYFPSQRAGDTIHSPKHCLPGAGWLPVESTRITLSMPGLAPFPANRYVISKGESRQLVLYWYWAHDRGVASEYWAKVYLVADAMRMNRSDGALVRIITEMLPGETAETAQRRLAPFASGIVPLLNDYIPR
jgi:exosortase D (VPLPA-CTERM-specific)